ncbi:MAG: dynamin family protein [Pseudonocardia sp.]
MAVPDAIQLVELALKASDAYGRPDLAHRLRQTRKRLGDPAVRVLVVGEFKQGKSQLVNALAAAQVCPVDDDIATAVPTAVRYAEKPSAVLVRETPVPLDAADPDLERPAQRTEVPIAKLRDHVSEAGNPGNSQRLTYVEVGLPRKILQGGLVLIDTPGVGGLGSAHGAATMAALANADAVLLVSDAAQEYTKAELDFLDAAMRLCPNVAGVLTKTDLYPQWRRIAEIDRGHLTKAGVQAPLFEVSSTLRLQALQDKDNDLNVESGFPALVTYLRDEIVAQSDRLDRNSARQEVLGVCEQLNSTMSAELLAQENPEQVQRLVSDLEAAKARAARLKERSSRWQITLNDGIADLVSDIDHDLRDRMRGILRDAEALADDADPAEVWDQYAAWLHKEIATAAGANFQWATERAHWLAEVVADHFASEGGTVLPELKVMPDGAGPPRIMALERPETQATKKVDRGISVFRGGYMGGLMVLFPLTIVGLGAVAPFAAGAAALALGRKQVVDDKKREKQRRQNDVKVAVRKHIDEVQFQVGKDSRDMLRRTQRALRDHYTAIAEELHTSITDSVTAAQSALRTTEAERKKRIADLKAEIERVEGLAGRAKRLAIAA